MKPQLAAALAVVTAAALLSVQPDLHARGKSRGPLAKAEQLAEEGRHAEAAKLYGKALARAQKKGDLVAEHATARSLDRLFHTSIGTGQAAVVSGAASSEGQREIMRFLMSELDPTRDGAFVSAPVLARRLLLDATEAGDDEHVRAAAEVLLEHADAKAPSAAAAAFASYAQGMLHIANEKPAEGAASLEVALNEAVGHEWHEVAAMAATEIAVVRVAQSEPERAAAALRKAADGFSDQVPTGLQTRWMRSIRKRLPDGPEEVLKVVLDLAGGALPNGLPTGLPTNFPGTGLGKSKKTDLGRALPKFSRSKPLVTVACTPVGFEAAMRFGEKEESRRSFSAGAQTIRGGGLSVTLGGRAVALTDATVENADAQGLGTGARILDGRRSSVGMTRVRAAYLLAPGETWAVSKAGVVTISR